MDNDSPDYLLPSPSTGESVEGDEKMELDMGDDEGEMDVVRLNRLCFDKILHSVTLRHYSY